MVKNKFLIYIIKLITIIAVVGCGSKAESDFNTVIEVMGDKFEKGDAQTGGASGFSWFTFDGDNLTVEYTAQANVTIEQTLTNSGNIYRETETYSLGDFKIEGRVDDDGNISKLISGKWDGNKFFYITFNKINKGKSLDEFGGELIGKFAEKDRWKMRLGVTWNDTAYAVWKGLLSLEQESELLPILELNEQDSDDKLAIDKALGSYNFKIYEKGSKSLELIQYALRKTIKYSYNEYDGYRTKFIDDEYDWKEYSSMYEYDDDIKLKLGSQIKRGPYMTNSSDCNNCEPLYIDGYEIASENPKFSFLIDGVDHNLNEFYIKFNDFLQADWKSKGDEFKKDILLSDNGQYFNDGSFSDIYIMFPASKNSKLNDLPKNVVLVSRYVYDSDNYFAFVINKNTDIEKFTAFDLESFDGYFTWRNERKLKEAPSNEVVKKEEKYVGSVLRRFLDNEIDEIKYDKININDISDDIIPAIYINSNKDEELYMYGEFTTMVGNRLLNHLELEGQMILE